MYVYDVYIFLQGLQKSKLVRIGPTSELPGVHEQDARRRRRRPVIVAVASIATGGGSTELFDAPDVLVARELGPVRHYGLGGVVGSEVGRQDGARGVLARDVVRVPAERAEERRSLRSGHAEAVEEVGPERAEDVGHGGHLKPRRMAVERARRGQGRAEERGRAADAEAEGARGVPDAEQRERWRPRGVFGAATAAAAALDSEVRAEGELVVEQGREVGREEFGGRGREQRGVGGRGERRGQAQHAVRARDAHPVPVHGVTEEYRPPERRVREAAGEERERRGVGLGGGHGGVRRAARRAPRLGVPDQLRGDPEAPAAQRRGTKATVSALPHVVVVALLSRNVSASDDLCIVISSG
jgi:hypothetical protein